MFSEGPAQKLTLTLVAFYLLGGKKKGHRTDPDSRGRERDFLSSCGEESSHE